MPVFRTQFYVCLLASVALLGGCEAQRDYVHEALMSGVQGVDEPEKSQDIQPAAGDSDTQWNVVAESDDGGYDPLEQHMRARGEVNPDEMSNKNSLVKRVDENHAKEKAHFRTLRLESQMQEDGGVSAALNDSDLQAGGQIVVADASTASAQDEAAQRTESINAGTGRIRVRGVRLGEHPGKTRLVLDVSDKVDFATWFQDSEHVFIVNMPDTRIDGATGRILDDHPLIKAYGFQVDDRGATQFIVTMKGEGKLVYDAAMQPNDKYTNHRIVLDVAKK